MATKSLTQLGLGSADLTAIGKLSETGLSQVEIADAVVEGDKLKKGNIPAGQVGAYTKAEVDGIIDNIPETDLTNYYNKTQVDNIIADIPGADLSNYYDKTETETLLSNKVHKVTGYSLLPDTEITRLATMASGATQNRPDAQNADKVHTHTISDVTGLDSTLAGKVDKVAGKGLSDTNFTQAEKDKLSSLESSKFVGLFVNESTLPSSGSAGDYANVDGGEGSDVYRVIWDTSDAKWVRVKGVSTELTDAQIKQKYESNPDTNAFTDDEKTKLTGVASGATKNRLDIENADKVHIHSPAEVGLGNVDNTSDEDKPISRAQGAALMAKFNLRNVAQETGNDAAKVMSQKASTEAFYRAGSGKAGKIYVQSTEPIENVEEGDIWLKI